MESPNKKKLKSGVRSTIGGGLGGSTYKTASPYNIKTMNMTNGLSPLMQAAVSGEEQVDPTEKIYIKGEAGLNYKEGDLVEEGDFEAQFKLSGNDPKDYPQLTVQDYSEIRVDENGPYVQKLQEGEEIKGLETNDTMGGVGEAPMEMHSPTKIYSKEDPEKY